MSFIINPYRFGGGGDPNFASVVLLAHFDGSNGSTTFTDNSPIARTITSNGGAALTTTDPKFGSASLLTDGSNDYASCAASTDWSFGTSTDFTIEFWLKSDSTDSQGCGIALQNNTLYVYIFNNLLYFGNGVVNMVTSNWSSRHNAWQFVMARRSGNTCALFVNGTSQGTYNTPVSVGDNSLLAVNYYPYSNYYGKGQIDDLRITKGVARANAVPTAAFPDS